MQSITSTFEKNKQEDEMSSYNQDEQNRASSEDLLINDPEFIKFSKECDDYSNFENLDDYYDGLSVVEDSFCSVPIIGKINPREDEWVLVGVLNKKESNEKVMINELCTVFPVTRTHRRKCQKYHSFDLLPLCVDCKNVEYKNNYYSGKCTKRHVFETIGNYLIRNEIKFNVEKINLNFFEKPSTVFVKNLLLVANKCGYKELTIEIEKSSRVELKDFLQEKNEN